MLCTTCSRISVRARHSHLSSATGDHRKVKDRANPASTVQFATSRRTALRGAVLGFLAPHWSCQEAQAQEDGPLQLPEELLAFWDECVDTARLGLGESFQPGLIVWSDRAVLPFGNPGNPAEDYTTKAGPFNLLSACGVPEKSSDSPLGYPYPGCPAPGAETPNSTLLQCCRHYAYCVPYTPNARSRVNQVTNVVIAPRVLALPAATARGILVHELGHCIDFHAYGGRYGLVDQPVADREWAQQLEAASSSSRDPEIRADLFAQAVLMQRQQGAHLHSPSAV